MNWIDKTSRGYDVMGPDVDDEISVEMDVDTNIIWLTKKDCQILLARFEPKNEEEKQHG